MMWLKLFEKLYGPLVYYGPAYPSPKSKLDSRARLRHNPRGLQSCKNRTISEYTQRQKDILDGKVIIDDIRMNELTLIEKKAQLLDDSVVADQAAVLKKQKQNTEEYKSSLTKTEAIAILEKLNYAGDPE